uniref:C2 domain-containing protein n=1 Tax=Ditylenchus dipsaci TaxID=166011 RepID=A0A915D9E3_9BILA
MNKDKGPRSRVELILSASSLADRDLFSRSDPICVVSQLEDGTWQSGRRNYVEVGRTERIKNCLNPRWNQKILMNYFFESKQSIRFEMYDIDSHSKTLTDHDFLGRAECELAQIVAAPGGRITLPVHHAGSQCGTLTVAAEELDEGQKETVNFTPSWNFYRILEDGSRQMVHRTEVIKKTVNPEWKPFEMTVRHLCENNKDRLSHDFIGSCQLSLNALTAKRENNFPLINEKKQKKKGAKYKDSGVLHFLHVDVRKEYTFLDFVTSGMQLEFAVAVDFTSSNGPVHSTTSPPLHQPFLSQPIRNGHQGCASDLPISIIIVGVGAEHFDKMDELDCDSRLLSLNGRSAKREYCSICSFPQLHDHTNQRQYQ